MFTPAPPTSSGMRWLTAGSLRWTLVVMFLTGACANEAGSDSVQASPSPPLVVATAEGSVEGELSEAAIGPDGTDLSAVRVFRGIPYALAPIGDLRWQPPQPPPVSVLTDDATLFGSPCHQRITPLRRLFAR